MLRLFAAVIFAFGFGLAFVYVGVRRIAQAQREKNPREAVVWGVIGILLGIAVTGGMVWLIVSAAHSSDGPPGPLEPAIERER